MKTVRVQFNVLDMSDNLIVYWNDKPFTGIGYDLNVDGKLWSEMSYASGMQEGIASEWSASGTLIVEEYWKRGNLHGSKREWFDDGKLRSNAVYEFGILVSQKEWDGDGNLTRTFQIAEQDIQYGMLLTYRKKYSKAWE